MVSVLSPPRMLSFLCVRAVAGSRGGLAPLGGGREHHVAAGEALAGVAGLQALPLLLGAAGVAAEGPRPSVALAGGAVDVGRVAGEGPLAAEVVGAFVDHQAAAEHGVGPGVGGGEGDEVILEGDPDLAVGVGLYVVDEVADVAFARIIVQRAAVRGAGGVEVAAAGGARLVQVAGTQRRLLVQVEAVQLPALGQLQRHLDSGRPVRVLLVQGDGAAEPRPPADPVHVGLHVCCLPGEQEKRSVWYG